MHQKLVSEGKVVPLTYSQLRRIERIDARKERDAKLLELAREGIIAAGRAAEGALSDQIVGPILVVGALASTEAGRGFLNAAGAGLIKLGADLAHAIRSGVAGIPTPPGTDFGPGGQYCFTIRAPFTGQPISEACFPDAASRDSVVREFKSRPGSNLFTITTTG